MATSSSDESITAPKDFHLSSSLDSGSRNSPNRQKCPLCNRFKKNFYCKECINNGDFYSSSSNYSDNSRYVDKRQRLYELKETSRAFEEKCMKYLEKKLKADELNSKIKRSKDWISIIKIAVIEKKKKLSVFKKELTEYKEKNSVLEKNLGEFDKKCEQMKWLVGGREERNQKARSNIVIRQTELKSLARIRVQQLIQFIFPITVVQSKIEVESTVPIDMVSALAEATHTTYVRDQWVYTDSGELQHCIVAPSLPSSGNYSAYNAWVSQNKDAVPVPGGSNNKVVVSTNAAYNISGALTYTAQLLNVLAFYLDVRLPHKMSYSDFCTNDITEHQFSRRIARLNANVLYLCFSQNTKLNTLNAVRALHNILQLLDTNVTDLGRQGPIEIDQQISDSLEEQLAAGLQLSDDSDSEEGDALPYEWEAVPHVQCPEAPAGPVIVPITQMTSTQQASSMAGGLVTSAAASIASFWRGWTGR